MFGVLLIFAGAQLALTILDMQTRKEPLFKRIWLKAGFFLHGRACSFLISSLLICCLFSSYHSNYTPRGTFLLSIDELSGLVSRLGSLQ